MNIIKLNLKPIFEVCIYILNDKKTSIVNIYMCFIIILRHVYIILY